MPRTTEHQRVQRAAVLFVAANTNLAEAVASDTEDLVLCPSTYDLVSRITVTVPDGLRLPSQSSPRRAY